MLTLRREAVARALAEGTGAGITISNVGAGLRNGLRIWFSDLSEKQGPYAELTPYGLKSHRVDLRFGSFSGSVIRMIQNASDEDLTLARSLVRSISRCADAKIEGPPLDSWLVENGGFRFTVIRRHEGVDQDSEEAAVQTCHEVIIPLMAAMAELIGYDLIEESTQSVVPEIEGGLAQAVVMRRERNPRNRLLALRIHGAICTACKLDPKDKYGSAGQIIEIHHLEPISMLYEPRRYNPESDLVPLCPNCHRAVHTSRPWPLSIEELKALMCANDA